LQDSDTLLAIEGTIPMNRILFSLQLFLFPVVVICIAVVTAGDNDALMEASTQEQTITLSSGRNLQQGCCSWHRGVCGCSGGRKLCCDGEFSPSCVCDDDDDDDDWIPEWTPSPTPRPTLRPTPSPTPGPTPRPTPSPTPEPTPGPTIESPTPKPTPRPTRSPTPGPTPGPTPSPTPKPTLRPTPSPTPEATPGPTPSPTSEPTPGPSTESPTPKPTKETEATELSQSVFSQSSSSTPPLWATVLIMVLLFLLGLVSGLLWGECLRNNVMAARVKSQGLFGA